MFVDVAMVLLLASALSSAALCSISAAAEEMGLHNRSIDAKLEFTKSVTFVEVTMLSVG